MKRCLLLLLLMSIGILSGVESAVAQTTVTFNVNLKPQLENGDFIPGRGDKIELTGNIIPLRPGVYLRMRDQEPIDSVYSVTVPFSRNQQDRSLSYNYVLTIDGETLSEDSPHRIVLRGRAINLDALYFGSNVW